MGNTQCGRPLKEVNDDDGKVYFLPSTDSNPYGFEESDLCSNFLQLHLQERADRCMLGPKLIVQGLVHQAEELIRRELEDNSPQGNDINDTFSSFSDVYARTDLTGFLSSVAPSTALTSVSAATRVVANKNRYSKRKKRMGEEETSPRVLGKQVDLNDTLHLDLYYVIEAITREEERKRFANTVLPKSNCKLQPEGCSILPDSMVTSPTTIDLYQAKMHMIVLHLRMAPRNPDLYQSQLSQRMPSNPFTEAMSKGITSSMLAPSRNFRKTGILPDLIRNDSDTASSMSNDIEFGAGPSSRPIKMLVSDQSFLDLGITGSLGMIDQDKTAMEAQRERKFLCPPERYMVLMNRRSGAPLAVCALKSGETRDPVMRIYATKIRAYGQRPAATTRQLGLDWSETFPLYAWAEITTQGSYPNRVQYSIFMATGNDGRFEESPSYFAEHSCPGSPEIRVLGKTERESEYTGCATLCLSRDDDASGDDLYFRLSVSKGVDLALLICFASFVDESIERTMRMQLAPEGAGPRKVSRVSSV